MGPFLEYLARNGMTRKQHQIEGVSKMKDIELNGRRVGQDAYRGGILADEMGLGKTAQVIGVLLENIKPHTLIVVPRALLEQWHKAILDGTGHDSFIYHATTSRSFLTAPVVLTTYGKLVSDYLKRRKQKTVSLFDLVWNRVVFDEAHHLRTPSSRRHQASCELRTNHTWLVTGTPIQNSVQDLYNLYSVVGVPRPRDLELMPDEHRQLLIRRTKAEANLELPRLTKHIIEVPWGDRSEQDWASDVHSQTGFSRLESSCKSRYGKLAMHHFVVLQRARQCCTDMSLLQTDIEKLREAGVQPVNACAVACKSKLDRVVEEIVKREGTRKLVFCHYRKEIDSLFRSLEETGLRCARFDGRVTRENRREIVSSKEIDVLILQIQTGCEGLNLQQFSEVYFTTSHWNPGVEDQAIARCHRMGQKRDVEVFVFRMKGFGEESRTLDGYIRDVQRKKRVAALHINEAGIPTGETCSICMQDIMTTEQTVLDCGHVFHDACMNRWLLRGSSCPTCRAVV